MSEINIVLLGETGVGKTTFINALLNHITYDQLEDAKRIFTQLIPTTFTLTSSDLRTQTICTGQHPNECHQIAFSATQNPIIYRLPYRRQILQIVDTPGLGDTRGIDQEEQNAITLVTFIGQLKHVNAICIFLKSTECKLNVLFKFCINHILSKLDRGLLNNITFIFTNGRSSSFRVGDALQSLNLTLRNVSSLGATIHCTRENTFCLDNETFRYLAARSNGIKFTEEEEEIYKQSWSKSALEYTRLITHILTLRPSSTHTIVSVRDSKMVIAKMGKPLVEIMVLYEQAIGRIIAHREEIQTHQDSIEELKSRLYIPVIEYKITKKTTTNTTSAKKFEVGASLIQLMFGIAGSYKNKDLTETQSEEIVEPYETKREDAFVKTLLLNETNKLSTMKQNLKELMQLQEEFTAEMSVIIETAAKFVVFVIKNAVIAVDRDPFQMYIQTTIAEEKICKSPTELINNLERLLIRYEMKKQSLTEVTSNDVNEAIPLLLNLKHSGSVFRQLYNELRK